MEDVTKWHKKYAYKKRQKLLSVYNEGQAYIFTRFSIIRVILL